jgi:hypothetical protein
MEAYYNPFINGAHSRHIFSCIDLWSGKCFAIAINNRDNTAAHPTLRNAFQAICLATNTTPHIVKVDSEFAKGNIKDWMEQNNITIIKSRSYVPTDNSHVERINRELRKKIRAGMLRYNSFSWVQRLQTYVRNINNQRKEGETQTPNEKWTPGYNPNNNQQIVQQGPFINPKRKEIRFRVGDLVRLKMTAYSSKMRERVKSDMQKKKTVAEYSPLVYRVINVYNNNGIRQYSLTLPHIPGIQPNPGGVDINLMQDNMVVLMRYYPEDLLKIYQRDINQVLPNSLQPNTLARALQINKIN